MRRIFLALAILTLAAPACAEPGWNTPGWYQVADSIFGPIVWSGPYTDEASCRATLPPNEDEADYSCEFLAERPDWDE